MASKIIAVIDYLAGNIRSVVNALEFIGQQPLVTGNPADLNRADAIILPGVGSFGEGMANLRRLQLIEPLHEQVIEKGKPYLGICLGLEFLAQEGSEHGRHEGLGWIPGKVERIQPCSTKYRVPHMGWNNVRVLAPCPLFDDLEQDSVFYFVHSYHFVPENGNAEAVVATAWHGEEVTAAIRRGNAFGVQFHPEKSQKNGLTLLENFIKMIR